MVKCQELVLNAAGVHMDTWAGLSYLLCRSLLISEGTVLSKTKANIMQELCGARGLDIRNAVGVLLCDSLIVISSPTCVAGLEHGSATLSTSAGMRASLRVSANLPVLSDDDDDDDAALCKLMRLGLEWAEALAQGIWWEHIPAKQLESTQGNTLLFGFAAITETRENFARRHGIFVAGNPHESDTLYDPEQFLGAQRRSCHSVDKLGWTFRNCPLPRKDCNTCHACAHCVSTAAASLTLVLRWAYQGRKQ
eukprot:5116596-Amphidinium_carterae.2